MPVLSIYLGSSVISAGLIYSQEDKQNGLNNTDIYETLPYPLLNFHTDAEKEHFLNTFISQFLTSADPALKQESLQIKFVSLVESPLRSLTQDMSSVSQLYMGDTKHIFCANSFYFHAGKLIYANPYPKYTTDIYNEEEKINILFNLEVYPFNYPADEFSQSLYDDAIVYLQNSLAPKSLQAKAVKHKKEHFKQTKDLVFTGDRFTYYKAGEDSAYYLALSLLDEYGLFSVKIDTKNVSTHKLNYAKSFASISDAQIDQIEQNSGAIVSAGTFIKFIGSAECLFESQVGTKQLFQMLENQIQIIPLATGEKAKITVKGSGFDTFEATVEGGDLGVVFFNFAPNREFFVGLQAGFAKEIKSAIKENLAKF